MKGPTTDATYLTRLSGAGASQWRDVVSRLLVGIEISGRRPEFWGNLQCRTVRSIRFADVSASPNQSRSLHKGDGERPAYILCHQVSGRGAIRQDGREAELGSGDLAFYATDRDSEIVIGPDFRAVSMRVPIDLIGLPRPQMDGLRATTLTGQGLTGQGIGTLMGGYLVQAADLLDHGSLADRAQAARTGIELFTTILRTGLGAEPGGSAAPRARERLRIEEFIESRLGDPALGPVPVARAMHISVRQLHSVFAGGETVAALIRRRRLDRCERDLRDPRRVNEPIAAIARRWGFESPPHFGQLFREEFGQSPGSYRAAG